MEITKEYKLAYVEVLEVLKKLNKSDYSKIPTERIELYEKYKDENYSFNFDEKKEIIKQISKTSQLILANLFIKYISSDDEKKIVTEQKNKQYWKSEEQKKEQKLNNLFEPKKQIIDTNNINLETDKSIMIKKDNFINRIFSKIKMFFYKIKNN